MASRAVVVSTVLTIRGETQFYNAVRWCNHFAGKGNWTVKGKILAIISPLGGKVGKPCTKNWEFFVPVDVDSLRRYLKM